MTDATSQPRASDGFINVRPLVAPTRIEVEQLAVIFNQYRAHYGEFADDSRTRGWLEENVHTSRLKAFVAEDNREFIGFAMVLDVPASLRLDHFWQIRDLFVSPPHRRLGVGEALLNFVYGAAVEAGALRLSLQTESDNASALRLYMKSGYSIIEGFRSLTLPLTPNLGESI